MTSPPAGRGARRPKGAGYAAPVRFTLQLPTDRVRQGEEFVSAEAIAEMARVAKPAGRVVLAIANFESLACRTARALDDLREGWLGRAAARGRRHYDVPADHFTRYDLPLMREQAERSLELEATLGISLAWGLPAWTRAVSRGNR